MLEKPTELFQFYVNHSWLLKIYPFLGWCKISEKKKPPRKTIWSSRKNSKVHVYMSHLVSLITCHLLTAQKRFILIICMFGFVRHVKKWSRTNALNVAFDKLFNSVIDNLKRYSRSFFLFVNSTLYTIIYVSFGHLKIAVES